MKNNQDENTFAVIEPDSNPEVYQRVKAWAHRFEQLYGHRPTVIDYQAASADPESDLVRIFAEHRRRKAMTSEERIN